MKILLINHYAGAPELGMEFRPYYMAREWIRAGHEVTIVASTFSHVRYKQPEQKEIYKKEIIDGIDYLWVKTPAYYGNGLKRIINIMFFLFELTIKFLFFSEKKDIDVVIASSTYPLDIYPAWLISRKFGAKLIYEVHDLWPLSPVELGGFSKKHPFIMLIQAAEDFAYKHVDSVVSLLPKTLEYMKSRGLSENKWYYVPNGVVVEEWNCKLQLPEIYQKLFEKLKMKNNFIVGYVGGLGLSNSVCTLVEAAKLIDSDKISVVIVGNGPEAEKLVYLSESKGIKNVYFLPAISKDKIPALLNKMDTLFIGLQKQSLFRFGISPNKIFDYMMAEKPIIQAIEAGNNIVKEANCGLSIEAENPQAIARAIAEIKNMPLEKRLELGENGKNYVLKNHDYKNISRDFLNILRI